jgi:DNA polymerase-3 subunit epsilon
MNPKNKFWWFAGVSGGIAFAIIAATVVILWQQLSPQEKIVSLGILKRYSGYIFAAVIILIAGLVFGLDAIFHNYIIPISKLAEATVLIHSVNPSHRIKIEGSKDCIRLAVAINESADRYESLKKDVEEKIRIARAEAEDEKNLLAAFMAELPQGVVICNSEGQILLYNKQAKQFLEFDVQSEIATNKANPQNSAYVGLGRSIFGIIDKNLIVHALDEIADKLKREAGQTASYFVIAGKGSRLLRSEAVPILNRNRQFTGFILILEDITRQLENDNRVSCLLQSFTRSVRASLAGIRSAIEAIIEYPEMDSSQLNVFSQIIYNEAVSLSNFIDKTGGDNSCEIRSQWPLVQMSDNDLIEALRKKAQERLNISIKTDGAGEKHWIKVDSYSLVLSMLFLLNQLKEGSGIKKFTCCTETEGRFVKFDLLWQGNPIKIETLREWEEQLLIVGNEAVPLTLKEVIGHHEAEIWSHSCKKSSDKSYLRFFKKSEESAYLRILLPLVETSEPVHIRNMMILPEQSRPEFYDFNLFNQAGQNPELDKRLLSELTYTVFDTETTGLDPGGGDEIISVGAVRIVNGRLLHDEVFDQLVDPRRAVPQESIKVHGIQPEMLKGQPTIDKVLPLFHRFAEDTILVGHNAAFDMRMLQLKEEATGVKFINPVLDTLLLSAVVHPAQDAHSMEAIAERLGVSIMGRHTALGDAIATGELFLKLIPLLAENGIRTLAEARIASQKTYYARIKY